MSRRASKYKASALKLFKEGVPPSEIAERLNFSKSLLYRWIDREHWTSPLASASAPIEAISQKVQAGDSTGWVQDLLQTKLPDRVAELDELCRKGNVSAIGLWFRLTGSPWQKADESSKPDPPTFVMNLHVKNGKKPTVIDAEHFAGPSISTGSVNQTQAEPGVNITELPETAAHASEQTCEDHPSAEPVFVNDLPAPGMDSQAVTEHQLGSHEAPVITESEPHA